MRYTLLLHWTEPGADGLSVDMLADGQRAFASYAQTLAQAGVLLSAEVLEPSSATTTVSMHDGALRVHDGPFADTKEQLGGTFVIDVPDLPSAIEWARQAPPAQWGAVEVRAGAVHYVDGSWTANT